MTNAEAAAVKVSIGIERIKEGLAGYPLKKHDCQGGFYKVEIDALLDALSIFEQAFENIKAINAKK